MKTKGSEISDFTSLGNLVEYEIVEKLSRVQGISEITFRGGSKKELKIAGKLHNIPFFPIYYFHVFEELSKQLLALCNLRIFGLFEGHTNYCQKFLKKHM